MGIEDLLPEFLRRRYSPESELGRGGFGVVVRAMDRELNRPVAIKLLTAGPLDEEMRARFLREARATSALVHPNVVGVYDQGIVEGAPYIVYELIEGIDLEKRLRVEGPPDPETARHWAEQGARALGAVHEAGLVHRDVKPENVLVRENGDLVLLDLGIVRPEQGEKLTATGMILGTPAYMAPELWEGRAPSPASDQFGWAATLVAALTGELVYGGATPGEVIERLRKGGPLRLPPELRGRYPDLVGAMERGLSWDPAARFPDMAAFVVGLEAPSPVSRSSPTVRVRSAPPPAPAPRPQPRSRLFPALLGASFLGLGLLLLGGLSSSPEPPPPAIPTAPRSLPDDALDQAWEELLRVLEPDGNWERLQDLLAENPSEQESELLAGETLERPWNRLLETFGEWLVVAHESAPGLPGAGAQERMDRVQGMMTILLRRYGRASEHASRPEFQLDPENSLFPRLEEASRRRKTACRNLLGVVDGLPPPRHPWVEFLRIDLALVADEPDLGPRLVEVARTAQEVAPAEGAYHLVNRLPWRLRNLAIPAQADCEQAARISSSLTRALRTRAERKPDLATVAGLAHMFLVESNRLKSCRQPFPGPHLGDIVDDIRRSLETGRSPGDWTPEGQARSAEVLHAVTRVLPEDSLLRAQLGALVSELLADLGSGVRKSLEALRGHLGNRKDLAELERTLLSEEVVPFLNRFQESGQAWLRAARSAGRLDSQDDSPQGVGDGWSLLVGGLEELHENLHELESSRVTGKNLMNLGHAGLTRRTKRLKEGAPRIRACLDSFAELILGFPAPRSIPLAVLRLRLLHWSQSGGVDERIQVAARRLASRARRDGYPRIMRRQVLNVIRERANRLEELDCEALGDALVSLEPRAGDDLVYRLFQLRVLAKILERCSDSPPKLDATRLVDAIEEELGRLSPGEWERNSELRKLMGTGKKSATRALEDVDATLAGRLRELGGSLSRKR